MMNIPTEDTYPSHMEYFGSVYRKSVLEAMAREQRREAQVRREKENKKAAEEDLTRKREEMKQVKENLDKTMREEQRIN